MQTQLPNTATMPKNCNQT